jgi:hypothetical protein
MRVRKTEKQLKEVDVVVEDYETCDKCGCVIKLDHDDAFDFDFRLKTGYQYYDSGSGEYTEIDLCEPCSKQLVQLMNENGFKTRTEEWDD